MSITHLEGAEEEKTNVSLSQSQARILVDFCNSRLSNINCPPESGKELNDLYRQLTGEDHRGYLMNVEKRRSDQLLQSQIALLRGDFHRPLGAFLEQGVQDLCKLIVKARDSGNQPQQEWALQFTPEVIASLNQESLTAALKSWLGIKQEQ